MAYVFSMPARTLFGEQALSSGEAYIRDMGTKALIVTGRHVAQSPAAAQLMQLLSGWGVQFSLFDGITGEPTDRMIEQGVAAFKESGCDFLIGIGGGSPLDSAKAIGAMTVLPGKLADYMGKEMKGPFPPLVLIPTTAGTGSEATRFAVITDEAQGVKMLLRGDALLPQLAVVDPRYAMTAPARVTAATGMDALTHAVEAYTSRRANPVTDLWAIDAIQRIFKSLPVAYRQGGDVAAREDMAIAAYEAGVCIHNSSVTLVHGMSRPIGALYHVPHGISNAMLIKACLSFALDGCYGRFAAIARAIGAAGAQEQDRAAAKAFLGALDQLLHTLEIPTLEQYGIDRDAFLRAADKMAGDALASGSPGNTIKQVTKEDMLEIYQKLWQ